IRQHYAAAWECELAGTYGRPVVLEEFGVSSDHVSDAHAARYCRQSLHNSLLAGATGWIAWCNTDFDALLGQDPYRHHAFELGFGLTDATAAPSRS
ncbi:MAG TPA: beta-mannosidase, partial [Streptosporangiaceae bacterium]